MLVARLDSDGDVLLAGPAVRAVAAAAEVVLLVGPRGRQAAALLPGVAETLVWPAPWIDPSPDPVDASDVDGLVAAVRAARVSASVVLTSFHQSALPLALLLRLAGVAHIAAVSEDYPGSLLDVRHRVDADLPEAERGLSTVAAAGFGRPPGDDGRLRVRTPLPPVSHRTGPGPYVVLHPGASVPARAWSPHRAAAAVEALTAAGRRVVVTGGSAEAALTAAVAGRPARIWAAGPSFAELAAVLAGAARSWSATPARRTSPPRSTPRSSRCSRRSCRRPGGPRTECRACCSATRTRPAGRPGRPSARCPAIPAWTR